MLAENKEASHNFFFKFVCFSVSLRICVTPCMCGERTSLGYGSHRLTCLRHVLYAVAYTRPESFRGIASLHHPAPSKISGIIAMCCYVRPCMTSGPHTFSINVSHIEPSFPSPSHCLNTCSSLEPKESHAFYP